MIPKLITNSYDFGEMASGLVPLHSRGIDGDWLRKHASHGMFSDIIPTIRPEKGKTVIHVIALGDEEIMGPNRNGDAFSAEDNAKCHTSFKDIGHVFRNHANDDPFKAVGDVIATAHNKTMARVELLLGLDNDKCRREIDAIDRGEDCPLSMGSMQDYDACSICRHQAPTADKHCFHVKNMLGQLLDDGRKVYMKNPNPKFFDISLVFKPADRIAYTLKKVAAAGSQVIGGHDLAEIYGVRGPGDPKTAAVKVIASIEKRIPLTARGATNPIDLAPEISDELKKHAKLEGLDHLLAFLNSNGWLLSPHDFGKVIGHGDPDGCAKAVEGNSILDELIDDHTEIEALRPPMVPHPIPLGHMSRVGIDDCCSMHPDQVDKRAVRIMIVKRASNRQSTLDESEARGFASLYGHYKLAFAAEHRDNFRVLKALAATF